MCRDDRCRPHASFKRYWEWNLGLCACSASNLPTEHVPSPQDELCFDLLVLFFGNSVIQYSDTHVVNDGAVSQCQKVTYSLLISRSMLCLNIYRSNFCHQEIIYI